MGGTLHRMKIIRYEDPSGSVRYAALQADGLARRINGDVLGGHEFTQERAVVRKLLAPIVPSAIICIGLNYRRHAQESKVQIPKFPMVLMKTVTAVQNPGDPIILPRFLRSDEVDYEGELAVVIGKRGKNIHPQDAMDYVLGYACGNDVSARDWQFKWGSNQWCRGKTFDTFAPLGPCLALKDSVPHPGALKIRTLLNGEVMQDCSTSDMIFDIPALVSFLSGSTTLLPGTVIFTGTPHGVGFARKPPVFLKPGDSVTVEIDAIGALTNPVIEEP